MSMSSLPISTDCPSSRSTPLPRGLLVGGVIWQLQSPAYAHPLLLAIEVLAREEDKVEGEVLPCAELVLLVREKKVAAVWAVLVVRAKK